MTHRSARIATLLTAVLAAALVPALAVGSAGAAPTDEAPVAAAAKALQVVDSAAADGIFSTNESFAATAVDYDGDGDQDVWVGFHDQGGSLYRNNGSGRYTVVNSPAWGKKSAEGKFVDRHACDFADVDGNGFADAYCGAGRGGGDGVKIGRDNELWLQTSAGVWSEQGTAWGIGDVCGRSHHVAFISANDDSRPDIYVGNASPRTDPDDPCDDPANGYTNEKSKLLLNQGGTGFRDAPTLGIGGNGGVRCAETLDVNGDGREDLIVCANPRPQLFVRNARGTGFTNQAVQRGLTTQYTDLAPADMDGDGDVDLVAVTGRKVLILDNLGDRFVATPVSTLPTGGQGRRVAVGDADGDGRLDIYAVRSNLGALTNPDDVILVRNTTGSGFTTLAVPSAGGVGDEVTTLDGDGDGRSQFLVLNGAGGKRGPVQLISVTGSR